MITADQTPTPIGDGVSGCGSNGGQGRFDLVGEIEITAVLPTPPSLVEIGPRYRCTSWPTHK